jgi:hypothetical protein
VKKVLKGVEVAKKGYVYEDDEGIHLQERENISISIWQGRITPCRRGPSSCFHSSSGTFRAATSAWHTALSK